MEPKGSLPHSQQPATCPYPEPARSSLYPHILLPYPPIYAWVSQVVSFPQVSPPIIIIIIIIITNDNKRVRKNLLDCLTLDLKALPSSETSETTHPKSNLLIPLDLNLQRHCCRNSKSRKGELVPVRCMKAYGYMEV
jgi:hypothetical protein